MCLCTYVQMLIFSPMEYRTSKNKSSTNKKTLNGHFTTDHRPVFLTTFLVSSSDQCSEITGKVHRTKEWFQCRGRSFLVHRNLPCLPQNTNISRHSSRGRVWGNSHAHWYSGKHLLVGLGVGSTRCFLRQRITSLS